MSLPERMTFSTAEQKEQEAIRLAHRTGVAMWKNGGTDREEGMKNNGEWDLLMLLVKHG